jgi:hypothetical protein
VTRLEKFKKEFQEQGQKVQEARSAYEVEQRKLRKLVLENLGVDPEGNISIEAVLNLTQNTIRMMGEKVDG